ncbi:MAG: alanine racemase [Clostridiales bacterium]|nr:alanine racemase [Clostridiales bacterium]
MTEPFVKRTWIDVDLDKLTANYRTACSLAPAATVTCVIKSNAYGHGAVRVAEALQQAGCGSFAVSCAREALELRKSGIRGEVFVMGLTEKSLLSAVISQNVTLTAGSVRDIMDMEDAAAALDMSVNVQIKVDTGFHRLGIECTQQQADEIAAAARGLRFVKLQGLFSHLGLVTQERDELQHKRLMQMHRWLAERGVVISDVHICDSIGLVRYPQWHHSRVRVGAMLFGVRPSRSEHMPFENPETLAFRTIISRIHQAKAGEVVGYGDDMVLDYDARIATLCVGYGDGYPRCLSNGRGKVCVHGQLAQVVGLVCMDQMMVDVTDIPQAREGDEVDLLGGGIPYMTYADWAGTNRNEAISILSRRPVRVYRQGGRIVTVLDSMLEERRDFE